MRFILALLAFFMVGCGGTVNDPYLNQLDILQDQIDALNLPQDTVVATVNPCPSQTAQFEEVLVCVDGNSLMALFYNSSADELFLAELPSGTYVTTDSRACTFTVVDGCNVVEGTL